MTISITSVLPYKVIQMKLLKPKLHWGFTIQQLPFLLVPKIVDIACLQRALAAILASLHDRHPDMARLNFSIY
jgi:hypothetical protein